MEVDPYEKEWGHGILQMPTYGLSDKEISHFFISLAKKCKFNITYYFHNELRTLKESSDCALKFIRKVEYLSVYSKDLDDDGDWKPCSGFTFQNLEAILLFNVFAKVLRNLDKFDKDLCNDAAKLLEDIDNNWQVRFTFEEDEYDNEDFFTIRAFFFRPGTDRCLSRLLKVVRPAVCDSLLILLSLTDRMVRELITVCNELQIWYNQNPCEEIESADESHGGMSKTEIEEWLVYSRVKYVYDENHPILFPLSPRNGDGD